jgi:elongation factor Tu
MSDNELLRSRPHLNVGTIGHHRHGKTTLAAALTRVLTTQHGGLNKAVSVVDIARGGFRRHQPSGWLKAIPSEVTVDVNKVFYESPQRFYGHVDLPGRIEFYKNMARGASQVDAVILVISAEESIMPQTREYLLLAKQLGASQLIIFINKCDLIEDLSLLDLIEEEARLVVSELGLDGNAIPVLRGSALLALNGNATWETTILSLAQALDADLNQPERLLDAPPLLEIEKVFLRGPSDYIVLGRLARGMIRREHTLEIIGSNLETPISAKVIDIEMFHRKVNEAIGGDIIGLRLQTTGKLLLRRGHILCAPKTAILRQQFSIEATLLTTKEGGRHTPIFDGHMAQFYMGTNNITGTLQLPTDVIGIAPGQTFIAEVALSRPALLETGRSFIIRDGCDGLRRLHGGPRVWGGTAGFGHITKAS